MKQPEALLFSYHREAFSKLRNLNLWEYEKSEFVRQHDLYCHSRMMELMKQESMLTHSEMKQQQQLLLREPISIDKFVLDLISGFKEKVQDSNDVPFYLNQYPKSDQLKSLLLFRRMIFESEHYFEEYMRKRHRISIYTPMFKCFCSFVKEEYDLQSKRSSMLNHLPFLKFMIDLFHSLGVEVKTNDYLRDEMHGNILINQLLTISYEKFNLCGIVSSDLSRESEEEWRNCIYISQIMQRRNKQQKYSLCFVIHGRNITFFYTKQLWIERYFVFNKLQTWDICNIEHAIEIVGALFNFIVYSWTVAESNPFGYESSQLRCSCQEIELYEEFLEEERKDRETAEAFKNMMIRAKNRKIMKQQESKVKVELTDSVIEKLLNCTINK